MKNAIFSILLFLHVLASPLIAQQHAEPILLWPEGAPGATGTSDEDKPAIIPFLPEASKATGAAVLVIPGGGFTIRATDHEGVLVSQWFKKQGIAAFLLRYRLRPLYQRKDWLADGQRAMQYIRAHAGDFNISEDRIGAIGFSAGANLAADLAFHPVSGKAGAEHALDQQPTQPNFIILAYGAMQLPEDLDQETLANLPPTFFYGTAEDAGSLGGMIGLYSSLHKAKVPVEAHFFRNGEHGTGFAIGDPILGEWPGLMHNWLTTSGFLTEKPRHALNGLVKLDGEAFIRGMLILSPVDEPQAPPIVVYITNTGTGELGRFSVPAEIGAVEGKYKVELRQEATRWTSTSRDPFMIEMTAKQRNNTLSQQDIQRWGEFLRNRDMSPSIEDQRVFPRQRPQDTQDYLIDIKKGEEIVIEVFSK